MNNEIINNSSNNFDTERYGQDKYNYVLAGAEPTVNEVNCNP